MQLSYTSASLFRFYQIKECWVAFCLIHGDLGWRHGLQGVGGRGGGGGASLNVIFSGGRVAGAMGTVTAVAVLMVVATIPMATAAAATVTMEVITDILNITIYTEFTEVHSQRNT